MNMLDRISLAKAGYKKKEIEEMLEAGNTNNEESEKASEENEAEEEIEETEIEETEIDDSGEERNIEEPENDLIKELTRQVSELQKELKEAQKKNTREQIETSNKLEDIEKHINSILMESEE